jgi:hypothetical protein
MTQHPPDPDADGAWYEIRLRGRLGPRWADRFDRMTLSRSDDRTTVLSGWLPDQAALHGVLRTLGDLAIPLISVRQDPSHREGTTHPGGSST